MTGEARANLAYLYKIRNKINHSIIIREEATVTPVLAGFHAGPLSCLNWNLEMLVFVEEGKLENPRIF